MIVLYIIVCIFALIGLFAVILVMWKTFSDWHPSFTSKNKEEQLCFTPKFTPITLTRQVDSNEICFDNNDIIYFSKNSNSLHDKIIQQNIKEIKKICAKIKLRFVYLPDYNKTKLIEKQIMYYNPSLTQCPSTKYVNITYDDIIKAYKIPNNIDFPCIIHASYSIGGDLNVSISPLESNTNFMLILELKYYVSHLRRPKFRAVPKDLVKEIIDKYNEGKTADERFEDDVYLIALEIKEKVEKLRSMGVSALAIRKLVGDVSRTPSPILIDKNYKITFTDFNNRELELSPVNKAVFLLFLNHPEGIYFKELPDYKNELLELYQAVTVHDDMEKVRATVERLTNPMDNSINEKCARIKNTLMLMFREEIASWYFIDGNRGEKKGIKLPRNLVTYEK